MRLERSEGFGPAWLPGAVRGALPGAELASVESYGGAQAVLLVRSATAPPPGLVLSPAAGELQLPFTAGPVATVESAQEATVLPALVSATPAADDAAGIALRLLAAGALLVAVWYMTTRVKRHEPGRA